MTLPLEKKPSLKYPKMFCVKSAMEQGLNPELIPPIARVAKEQARLHAHKDFLQSARHVAIAVEKEISFLIPVKSAADMER